MSTSRLALASLVAVSVAGPASAEATPAQHPRFSGPPRTAACSSGQVWSASDVHQAWLPAAGAPLSTPVKPGGRLTLKSTQVARSESPDYLLRRQLGPAASRTLAPAVNAATSRVVSRVRWRSLVRVGAQVPGDPITTIGVRNPLRTAARAVEFVTGYRLEVTLADRRCVKGVVSVERRPVYLYSQGADAAAQTIIVGWVAIGAHARALPISWQVAPVIDAR